MRRPNGKSNCIKTFNTFESLVKIFGYLFGIRFVLKNYVIWHHLYCSKISDFLKQSTFVRTACARSMRPIEMKLGKGLPYVCNLLFLTGTFYFQNQSPKCRVDGYKFRSVYMWQNSILIFYINTYSLNSRGVYFWLLYCSNRPSSQWIFGIDRGCACECLVGVTQFLVPVDSGM